MTADERPAEPTVTEPADAESPATIHRRGVIAKGAVVAGAAWAAPVIYGSFLSPAAAASTRDRRR